jgi:hypothetical protein
MKVLRTFSGFHAGGENKISFLAFNMKFWRGKHAQFSFLSNYSLVGMRFEFLLRILELRAESNIIGLNSKIRATLLTFRALISPTETLYSDPPCSSIN